MHVLGLAVLVMMIFGEAYGESMVWGFAMRQERDFLSSVQ